MLFVIEIEPETFLALFIIEIEPEVKGRKGNKPYPAKEGQSKRFWRFFG